MFLEDGACRSRHTRRRAPYEGFPNWGGCHFQDDDAGPMAGQQTGARGERQGQGTKRIGMDPIIPICTLYPKLLKGGYIGDCIGKHYRVD